MPPSEIFVDLSRLQFSLTAMFPFIMPSSTQPNVSLTAYDAVSSHLTLNLMFIAVAVFLPIVLLYTSWVYRVLRGKLSEDKIRKETHTAY